MLRQFHAEDITNTFALDSDPLASGQLAIETESRKNFRPGWKVKQVFQIVNEGHFVEVFSMAGPGKDCQEYVRNTFRRISCSRFEVTIAEEFT